MSTTAWIITVAYTLASIIGVAIGLIVFRSTRVGFRAQVAGRPEIERRESYWGVFVVVVLVLLLALTIFQIPYWDDKSGDADQNLSITGQQFAWTVDPPRVKADVSTAVDMRSTDVNHAIGIYDPDNVLVKQVNVLPGVTQRFVITFKDPGAYKLRCLEFCGVSHHVMENRLEVTR